MVLMRPLYCFLLLVIALVGPVSGKPTNGQRSAFLDAERALRGGDRAEFLRLSDELQDYPLHPYLEYQSLKRRLSAAGNDEVNKFLSRYAGAPVADLLRSRWLNYLASRKRWADYLDFYREPSGLQRKCHHLHALIATGRAKQALPQVAEIWLHGKSQPRACDPVFTAWTKAGYRTRELIWQRIEKAMEAGQWRLAKYLSRSLSNTDRTWVERWIALYQNPSVLHSRTLSAKRILTAQRC